MNQQQLLELPVYTLSRKEKQTFYDQELFNLTLHHYSHCKEYQSIIDTLYKNDVSEKKSPAIAVRLFKHHLLKSISDDDVSMVMTSSGTTSSEVSRIVLDKENIIRQQKVLTSIVKEWLGSQRLPMLIIDHDNVIKNKLSYSARGVGIQGLSIFGRHHTYALNEDMSLNLEAIDDFFERYQHQKIFVFGFTFMIWKYFATELQKRKLSYQFSDATILHSGGWKKLEDEAVSNQQFKNVLANSIASPVGKVGIHNFYGMVEQTGTIHVECEQGHLHCPIWNDIIIRDLNSLEPIGHNVEGIIQVNSLLPTSYPGHSLLTEDVGTVLGEDDCSCGRKGKYFTVSGRLERAEIRGCSDTQS